jgi:hypothetical protein
VALAFGATLGTKVASNVTTANFVTTTIVPAGGLIVMGVGFYKGGTITACSISGGGLTWQADAPLATPNAGDRNYSVAIFSAAAPVGLAVGTLTVTLTGGGAGAIASGRFTGTSPARRRRHGLDASDYQREAGSLRPRRTPGRAGHPDGPVTDRVTPGLTARSAAGSRAVVRPRRLAAAIRTSPAPGLASGEALGSVTPGPVTDADRYRVRRSARHRPARSQRHAGRHRLRRSARLRHGDARRRDDHADRHRVGEAVGTALVGSGIAAAGAISSGETFGADTVTTGPVELDPAGIASGEAFGQATITGGVLTAGPHQLPTLGVG